MTKTKLTDALPIAAVMALLLALSPLFAHGATVGELITQLEQLDRNATVRVQEQAGFKLTRAFDGSVIISPGDVVPGPPTPLPVPPTVTHRRPHGVAALQPGKQSKDNNAFPSGSRLISLAQLQDPDVKGYTIRFTAWQVKNDPQIYQKIQACIDNARRANVWYTLLPMGGEAITAQSLAQHDGVLAEVAKRWGSDPLFAGYHISGYVSPPSVSEELHWNGGMSTNNENWLIDYAHRARKALPGVTLIIALGIGDDAGMRRIATACRDTAPLIVKNNNLKAYHPGNNTFATWPNAPHNRLLVDIAKDPAIGIGEEMVGATAWSQTGSRDINDSLKQMAVLATRAGDKPSESYVAVYPEDLAAVNAGVLSP